jgi:type I restriction enzyme R subunit
MKQKRQQELMDLHGRVTWMETTLIAINISEAQNEARDFAKWNFDIIPHRDLIKKGFTDTSGKNLTLEDAFKKPDHQFRIAIVCAMWLTGFDVECLSTLYIDKPMKAHTLMQAIARANRVYPGKDCGLIVDYNGMLKSLRKALAQYAVGDDDALPADELAEPIEKLVASLKDALDLIEQFLAGLGFDVSRFVGAKGFARIAAIRGVSCRRQTSRSQRPVPTWTCSSSSHASGPSCKRSNGSVSIRSWSCASASSNSRSMHIEGFL